MKKGLGNYAWNYFQRKLVRDVVNALIKLLFPTLKSKIIVVILLIVIPLCTGIPFYLGYY